MGCEICGRGACMKSFHAVDEQQSFDDMADDVKDRAKEQISHNINRLEVEWVGDNAYVLLDDALSAVDDYS